MRIDFVVALHFWLKIKHGCVKKNKLNSQNSGLIKIERLNY